MRVATAEEAQYARTANQFKALPWAASKPGTMFDKPEDVLYSDGSMSPQTKKFLRNNDISYYKYTSRTPYADPQQMQSYIQCTGINYQTLQVGVEILLYRGSNNQDLIRCLDLLEPLRLPLLIQLDRYNKGDILVGQYWQVRGPDLNQSGIPGLVKSGDTWLVVFTRYHNTRVVHRAKDRADALDYCMAHYAKGGDLWQDDEEDQDD